MPSEVVDLFLELAALPSPPGEERPVADAVTRYLRDLGLEVDEDETGAAVGSNMGNLYCRVEGNRNDGTPIFLCAHLDTVPPQGPLEPVIEDGVVRNAGARATRPATGSAAARRTRTSSTSGGSRASISRTGCRTSTRRRNGSPSRISRE